MDFAYIILAILVFTAARCDAECNNEELLRCGTENMPALSALGNPDQAPPEQIQAACSALTALTQCIQPLASTCSENQGYMDYVQATSSASVMCAGGGAGTGDGGAGGMCGAMQCMALLSSMGSGQPEPESTPEPEPKVDMSVIAKKCESYDQFKACIGAADLDSCSKDIKDNVNLVKTNMMSLCEGECAIKNAVGCLSGIDVTTFENLSGGLPTVSMLEPLCKVATNFMSCVTDFFNKCPEKGNEQTESLKTYNAVVNVFCKEGYEALVKHQSCYENATVRPVLMKCVQTPTLTSDGQAKAESNVEMCLRIKKEQMCMDSKIEQHCGEDAKNSFSSMYYKAMEAFGGDKGGCGTSGAGSGFKLNVWISMLLAGIILAFFL